MIPVIIIIGHGITKTKERLAAIIVLGLNFQKATNYYN
jgi:hypothetical protein